MRTLFDRPASPDPATPVSPAEPTMDFDCLHACAVCGSPASFSASAFELTGQAVGPVHSTATSSKP